MKKIAFAWLTFWYDFTTKEEAEKFVSDNRNKGWHFEGTPYINGNNEWTVQVLKPYQKYNPGW